MPHKPKKPCSYPSCHRLTNSRYCEEHAKQMARHYDKHIRDPNQHKRYGSNWPKIRAAFLQTNPLCEICLAEGRLTPAELVHHKVKLTDCGTNEWANLMALCSECHSRLHSKRGDYFK